MVLVEGEKRCFTFLKVRFAPTECLEGRFERRFPSDFRFPVFCFDFLLLAIFLRFRYFVCFCDALFARVIFSEVLEGFIGGFAFFRFRGVAFWIFRAFFAPFVSIHTLQILTLFFLLCFYIRKFIIDDIG